MTIMREETGTYSRKTRNEKASGQEDHFRRLPVELFLSILTIVSDLKSLCQCSLVSKHFASVAFRVRTVCLTIPSSGAHSMESFKSLWTLPKPKPLVFLEKFKELESIYLEYKYPETSGNSCTKWKVKFSTDFPNVERLMALLPASAHKQTSNEPFQEQVNQQNNIEMGFKWKECYWLSYARYVEWMFVVSMLGTSHTSLKRVTVTDSEKQGKMVIGEEQLVRIRSVCVCEPGMMFQPPPSVEMASVPYMHLPLSGYVMKQVLLVIFNYQSCTSVREEILSWDFEDEEKVLGEAIKEIYKNHSDKVQKIY